MMQNPSVYVLLHSEAAGPTSVLAVFSDLSDANARCASGAADAGVKASPKPHEALRWEAPDGTSSWVERHEVISRKVTHSAAAAARPGLSRNESSRKLYNNDDDDVIELQEEEAAQYD